MQSFNFSSLDDSSLLGLIAEARGESLPTEALGALYDRYGRLVYTVAIHVVGDSETAEEITQDVFVRAWEGAHTYRPDLAKVSSWLISITRHRAIDELRRRGVRPEKDSAAWPEDTGLDHMDGLPLLDGPEEQVEGHLQSHDIRQVIATLPPDQREVLGLAYFKGLSHSQIAGLLNQPLGTVKSRIRQAMQKVRDALIEQGIVDQ
jgi:RNA polymerase sigma-70 factor (ECF subfamily)